MPVINAIVPPDTPGIKSEIPIVNPLKKIIKNLLENNFII